MVHKMLTLCLLGEFCMLFCRLLLCFFQNQAFGLMVGPGHCPMISKYDPSLSKAVGPVNPSFLVVKKFHFNKNIYFTGSLRTPQNRKNM